MGCCQQQMPDSNKLTFTTTNLWFTDKWTQRKASTWRLSDEHHSTGHLSDEQRGGFKKLNYIITLFQKKIVCVPVALINLCWVTTLNLIQRGHWCGEKKNAKNFILKKIKEKFVFRKSTVRIRLPAFSCWNTYAYARMCRWIGRCSRCCLIK